MNLSNPFLKLSRLLTMTRSSSRRRMVIREGTIKYLRALNPSSLTHKAAEEWKRKKFEYTENGGILKGKKWLV